MTAYSKKNRYLLSIPLVVMFAVCPIISKAQILGQTAFDTLLNQATADGGIDGVKFVDTASIKDFYVRRGSQPFWTSYEQAQMVLGVLDEAWTQGLNPQKYHVQALHNLIDDKGKYQAEEGRADLLLTDAVIRYGYDVSGMRLNPAAIDQRAQYWRQPEKAAEILKLFENSTEPARLVAAMAPHDSLYSLLRKEMVRVSREGAAYDSVLPMKFGRTYFHPHGRSKAVPALRMRLGVKYDPRSGKEDYYDDRLAAAVMIRCNSVRCSLPARCVTPRCRSDSRTPACITGWWR